MLRRALGPAAALAVFAVATLAVFGELWSYGPDRVIAVAKSRTNADSPVADAVPVADVTFEAWLVSRNARTLTTRPHRLFDAEHCAPAERSLTFGIPMITMGALAIPTWYATGNPILTYNLTIVVITLIAAFAMYGLVTRWTGRPAAGLVAGLLFAFHPIRLTDITHPSVWDASWTVLGLWFAERLFGGGRWRDAFGLAAAVALQMGASFYPLLAATFSLPPFAIWLAVRDRPPKVSLAQLAFVAGATLLAAACLLGPYLGVETEQGEMRRQIFAFAPLRHYLPGERLFPGFVLLALLVASLLSGRSRPELRIQGDPRGPLLAGAVLVALIAAGPSLGRLLPEPFHTLDLYGLFAAFLPGLDAVRGVMRLAQGAHLALALLAGLGAAALLQRMGRFAALAGIGLVLLAGFDVLRAPALGFERPYRWDYEVIAPDPEAVEFFAELERRGNSGPILELPLRLGHSRIPVSTRRILVNSYHGRRTSTCFGSYKPAGRDRLEDLAARLPEPDAIRALADLGFTTVILEPHYKQRSIKTRLWMRLERAARPGKGLERIHHTRERVAYALRPETLAAGD